jgi:hypothetical protein
MCRMICQVFSRTVSLILAAKCPSWSDDVQTYPSGHVRQMRFSFMFRGNYCLIPLHDQTIAAILFKHALFFACLNYGA